MMRRWVASGASALAPGVPFRAEAWKQMTITAYMKTCQMLVDQLWVWDLYEHLVVCLCVLPGLDAIIGLRSYPEHSTSPDS